jgi:hypothetical protein
VFCDGGSLLIINKGGTFLPFPKKNKKKQKNVYTHQRPLFLGFIILREHQKISSSSSSLFFAFVVFVHFLGQISHLFKTLSFLVIGQNNTKEHTRQKRPPPTTKFSFFLSFFLSLKRDGDDDDFDDDDEWW